MNPNSEHRAYDKTWHSWIADLRLIISVWFALRKGNERGSGRGVVRNYYGCPYMTVIRLVAATVVVVVVVVVVVAVVVVVVAVNSCVYIHLTELHFISSSRNIIKIISWRNMNLVKNVVCLRQTEMRTKQQCEICGEDAIGEI